jgi:hypothetical protein
MDGPLLTIDSKVAHAKSHALVLCGLFLLLTALRARLRAYPGGAEEKGIGKARSLRPGANPQETDDRQTNSWSRAKRNQSFADEFPFMGGGAYLSHTLNGVGGSLGGSY